MRQLQLQVNEFRLIPGFFSKFSFSHLIDLPNSFRLFKFFSGIFFKDIQKHISRSFLMFVAFVYIFGAGKRIL